MKRYLYLLVFVSWHAHAQYNEFKVHSNGLIYDESTMLKLGAIVDSLNLKFRTCDLSHPYYSYPQGMATQVEIPDKSVLKMIEDGISFSAFSAKYPKMIKRPNVWIMKHRYIDYKGTSRIKYSSLPNGRDSELSIVVKDKRVNDKTNGWIIDEDGLNAFYIEKLESSQLPYEYARLIQYADCMIDTTTTIYFPGAKGTVYQQVDEISDAHDFISWAERFPGKPRVPDYEKLTSQEFDAAYDIYNKQYSRWDSLRMRSLDKRMKSNTRWNEVLAKAANEGVLTGNSDARLEYYVARYYSKDIALRLMRSRRVIGNCSQDQSPRYHAMNICQLAAETTQWDIFLRAHLDIMNDRFERQSDGSYAWAERKTYLKELEELDIPAVDLLIGTSLQATNTSAGHYYGSISRVGRALADAADKDQLESLLISMIQNEKLDPLNRLLMAYLFSNYMYNLTDKSRTETNRKRLDTAMKTTPTSVQEAWKIE